MEETENPYKRVGIIYFLQLWDQVQKQNLIIERKLQVTKQS